jgi:2'-5' RNA ligase
MGSIGKDPLDSHMQLDDSRPSPSSSVNNEDQWQDVSGSIDEGNSRGQRTPQRGRSNRKRSQSQEENVCVVAFLTQPQDEKQKQVVDQIQEIRRRYDQAYSRWQPHLTLIAPFIAPFSTSSFVGEHQDHLYNTLEQVCRSIQEVCLHIDQHTLTLDEVGHFPLKLYKTHHLRPSSTARNDAFLHLQSELETALPQAISNARSKGKSRDTYKPHLTLGQSSNDNVNQQLLEQASQIFKGEADADEPFQIRVDKIQLMVKPISRAGIYDIYREFSLRK